MKSCRAVSISVLSSAFASQLAAGNSAIIVFPVSSALSLVLNTVASILWWGERLDRPTTLGLALAIAATVLLNRG